VYGVSRMTIHHWIGLAKAFETRALHPKERRVPQMPNATPTRIVDQVLQLAILEPIRVPVSTRLVSAAMDSRSRSRGCRTCRIVTVWDAGSSELSPPLNWRFSL